MRLLFALTLILQCLAPPAAASDELGRLFLTPQQRQDLDRRRATNRAEEEAPPQAKEGPLTVNGHIQRSGGKTATWINGSPEYDNHASRDPTQITVAPNPGEPGVRMKIGQTLDRASGQVRDNLEDGEIRIEKASPPASGRSKR
jgi:hypothetical protein